MSDELPAVAVALLRVRGRYALQLRDDRPDLPWAGHWGLFGGEVEPGETPAAAIAREVDEELGLAAPCRFLWSMDDHRDAYGRRRDLHVFEADVTDVWHTHRLTEGQAAALFDGDDLPARIVPMARREIERHFGQ